MNYDGIKVNLNYNERPTAARLFLRSRSLKRAQRYEDRSKKRAAIRAPNFSALPIQREINLGVL